MSSKAEWVSVSVYATLFSVNRKTVYKWRDAGLLTTIQVGRCLRVLNQPPKPRFTKRESNWEDRP